MDSISTTFVNRPLSRRLFLGTILATTGALAFPGNRSDAALQSVPARAWRTWYLADAGELRPEPPKPVTSAEIDELLALQELRNPTIEHQVNRWVDQPAVLPWTEIALDRIISTKPTPVRAGRALSLLATATFDAVAAANDAQFAYPRPRPWTLDPRLEPMRQVEDDRAAYPATQAVVAGAASTVLAYLFPDYPASLWKATEDEAANAVLYAGAGVRSDIQAGLELGHAIGDRAVAWAESDGSDARWDGANRPTGAGYWVPTPPAYVPEPLDPLAGTWRTRILSSTSEMRPPAPPAYGTALWQSELAAVQAAVAGRTQAQADAVIWWGGGAGTVTPAGLWTQIAMDLIRRDELSAADAARVLAYTNVAMYEGFLCCWDAKFTYWYARPITADPTLDTLLPTPPFPSFTSGHSTVSAAAATTLGAFFPADQSDLELKALEAKNSRLWAGIHFPIDNDVGAAGGAAIGRLVNERARSDLA
jgi:membrane-associated phospholipid phosphatase